MLRSLEYHHGMTLLAAYLVTGLVSGILAGLLGVGGGLITVPALTLIFAIWHLQPEHAVHCAIATSLACIVFTSLSSIQAHHRHHAVNWAVLRRITPGILAGTFCGALLAPQLSTGFLKGLFAVFACFAALRLYFGLTPGASRQLPGSTGITVTGIFIGIVSSLVGIGGGSLSVPFLYWCNVKMNEAIGTSSAIGFPIAVAGSTGYALDGFSLEALKHYNLGLIYLPALAILSIGSMLTAPFGAGLAHRLPVARLKKVFAFVLLAVGAKMLL